MINTFMYCSVRVGVCLKCCTCVVRIGISSSRVGDTCREAACERESLEFDRTVFRPMSNCDVNDVYVLEEKGKKNKIE